MCPGIIIKKIKKTGATGRGRLLCDKGVRADKHVCVKFFKDELNSNVNVGFEIEGERQTERGGVTGIDADICCAKLRVAVGISSFPDAH